MDKQKLIQEAEARLAVQDPILGRLISSQTPIVYAPRDDYFFSLARAITSQQISVASAAAIFSRLESVTAMDPAVVAQLTSEQTTHIGLSKQKTNYLRDLAAHFVENPSIYNHLDARTDEEIVTELTAIKGIGTWTAEMFLMFTLARLDVFAPDDVGLQRAIRNLYAHGNTLSKSELEEIADHWRPYRTVACWHLWQSLDNTPS